MQQKAGYVAIIGRPNVGKSTLINNLLQQKIAITSKKPQTTRHNLLGIYTQDNKQIIFIDTPGIHLKQQSFLNKQMNKTAWNSLENVSAVLHLTEANKWTNEDERVISGIKNSKIPVICLITKIDKLADKSVLLENINQIQQKYPYQAIIPISSIKKQNLNQVINSLDQYLPIQSLIFPEDQITTASVRFMAAEIVREKVFRYLHQEIPYQVAVIIEQFREEEKIIFINSAIILERASLKKIIIGENGQNLKQIGKSARLDLEKLLEKKVMLKNFIKIEPDWRNNQQIIQNLLN